jgi:hypothetical protein
MTTGLPKGFDEFPKVQEPNLTQIDSAVTLIKGLVWGTMRWPSMMI